MVKNKKTTPRIVIKSFKPGSFYSGVRYAKPLAKFAKFGTSGIRWLVKGASGILEKDRIDYYISNGYCRSVDGRTSLAEDFIMPNAGIVIKAIALFNIRKSEQEDRPSSCGGADFSKKLFEKGILVTYDNRPGNFAFAEEAAKILASYGIKAVLAKSSFRYVPTPLPAGSRIVKRMGYAGQITFTASHNGDEWNGIKFEGPDGGAAIPEVTNVIGSILIDELALDDDKRAVSYQALDDDIESLVAQKKVDTVDVLKFYAEEVASYLNAAAIKKAIKKGSVEFVYSAFYGSSGPAILRLFKSLGLATKNIIETAKSAGQGYISSYEPTLERLEMFGRMIRERGRIAASKETRKVIIGGAADNDADRFQVSQYDPIAPGEVAEYPPDKLAAVLAHYLYKYKRFTGPAGRSFVSCSLQDEVARLFGQHTIETPTGFKYSPRVFGSGGILFSEESYGLSFKDWTLDKDGILPSLLALELVAVSGMSLDEYYENMVDELDRAGLRSRISFKRYDMPLERSLKESAIKKFTGFFNQIEPGRTSFAGKAVSKVYNPGQFEGGMKFILEDKSWVAMRSSGTEPLIRIYIEAGGENEREYLRKAVLMLIGVSLPPPDIISRKLHQPLKAFPKKDAGLFLKGGYKQPGYGVSESAAIDGSFAMGREGDQGYFTIAQNGTFLNNVAKMRKFFENRAARLSREIKLIIKPGIGGQHTPFQAIADIFNLIDPAGARITGEYELGKDYEKSISGTLASLGARWDQIAVVPSSKSGSTDETMMVFTQILHLLLDKVASMNGLNGRLFADTVFEAMHEVNFIDGVERKNSELFKGFSIRLVHEKLVLKDIRAAYSDVKNIFGIVLGNMFFETTDRPQQSRLSAFVRNSELLKELDPVDVPGFGAMFDNVGGRWTADLHMMTFLAFYKLDGDAYWKKRLEGIEQVRDGLHPANQLARKILNDRISDIALVVPDTLFWFGKALEQNFNESIWQKGFSNLIAIKHSMWAAQKGYYALPGRKLVINMSGKNIPERSFNVVNIDYPQLKDVDRQAAAEVFGELFTTFYGMTHNVGNALIARALSEKGYSSEGVDVNDLDSPPTKVFQQNLYLRQPYVELGKGFLEKRLSELQRSGSKAIEKESKHITRCAIRMDELSNIPELSRPGRLKNKGSISKLIGRSVAYAKNTGRKLVPFIYLEGDKFGKLRDGLAGFGVEWVMQGTGDQHISYQQVLAQPKRYLPFIISVIPRKMVPGLPAIGFAKGYLDDISPNIVRDLFAEASYRALTKPRTDEAGQAIKGAAGVFLRIEDSKDNLDMLLHSFRKGFLTKRRGAI